MRMIKTADLFRLKMWLMRSWMNNNLPNYHKTSRWNLPNQCLRPSRTNLSQLTRTQSVYGLMWQCQRARSRTRPSIYALATSMSRVAPAESSRSHQDHGHTASDAGRSVHGSRQDQDHGKSTRRLGEVPGKTKNITLPILSTKLPVPKLEAGDQTLSESQTGRSRRKQITMSSSRNIAQSWNTQHQQQHDLKVSETYLSDQGRQKTWSILFIHYFKLQFTK